MSSPSHRVVSALLVALLVALGVARAHEPEAERVELAVDVPGAISVPPPIVVAPGGLPPEILKIQQELGGSVVNQFPSLQPGAPLPNYAARAQSKRGKLIAALRDAAWSMDSWANRLEALEAYDEADALRAHAQRLRVTARSLHAAGDPAPAIETSPAPATTSPTELR